MSTDRTTRPSKRRPAARTPSSSAPGPGTPRMTSASVSATHRLSSHGNRPKIDVLSFGLDAERPVARLQHVDDGGRARQGGHLAVRCVEVRRRGIGRQQQGAAAAASACRWSAVSG